MSDPITHPAIQQLMDMLERPGLQTEVWLQGFYFKRDPGELVVTPHRLEESTQTSSLGRRVDRAMVKPGWASVLEKHEIAMTWPDIREVDGIGQLNVFAKVGQPFHLGIWKPVTEVFDGDGVTADFYLQRRLLLPYVTPPVEWPGYPTVVLVWDHPFSNVESPFGGEPAPTVVSRPTIVHKTAATIGTGTVPAGEVWLEDDGHQEGDRWLTRVRFGTPPPDAPDVMAVQYLPLYRVVIDQEDPRTYREPLREPRGIKMVEV